MVGAADHGLELLIISRVELEPTVDVRPAYGRYEDFAAVVGTRKPGAAGCWCMAYRDSRVPVEERPAHLRAECAEEPGPGVLVHVDDVVAGWCLVAPRPSYRRLLNSRTIPILDHRDTWVAVCFVVRAGYRKRGLMHHLLAGTMSSPASTPSTAGPARRHSVTRGGATTALARA